MSSFIHKVGSTCAASIIQPPRDNNGTVHTPTPSLPPHSITQRGGVKPLTASYEPPVELSDTRKYFCDFGIILKIESLGNLALYEAVRNTKVPPKEL